MTILNLTPSYESKETIFKWNTIVTVRGCLAGGIFSLCRCKCPHVLWLKLDVYFSSCYTVLDFVLCYVLETIVGNC